MAHCPTTVWCRSSSGMLKHPPPGRARTCRHNFRRKCHTAPHRSQKRAGCAAMERDGGSRSTHERLSHHRVVPGDPHNAQTPALRPRMSVQTLISTQMSHSAARARESGRVALRWSETAAADRHMSGCPTTEWCRVTLTMLKHRRFARARAGRLLERPAPPGWPTYLVRHTCAAIERDGGTRSTHERPCHHRVVLGDPHDTQTPVLLLRTSGQTSSNGARSGT